jgi:hypothetical protein
LADIRARSYDVHPTTIGRLKPRLENGGVAVPSAATKAESGQVLPWP